MSDRKPLDLVTMRVGDVLRVDEMFSDPLNILTIPPELSDAETFRQMFDHPEQLAFHAGPFGERLLCLSMSLPSLRGYDTLLESLFAERGLTVEKRMTLHEERVKLMDEMAQIIASRRS